MTLGAASHLRQVMAFAGAILVACSMPGVATAGSNPYISEVHTYAFRFCPKREAPLDGELIDVSSNTSLFSLIGTYFGGDGSSTFQLPLARQMETLTIGSPLIRCIATQGIFPTRP